MPNEWGNRPFMKLSIVRGEIIARVLFYSIDPARAKFTMQVPDQIVAELNHSLNDLSAV